MSYSVLIHYTYDDDGVTWESAYFRADGCDDDDHAIEQLKDHAQSFDEKISFYEIVDRSI